MNGLSGAERAVKAILMSVASVFLIGGCLADQPAPSTIAGPETCRLNQVKLVAGQWGGAAGTNYLTVSAELIEGPPCLIATWPTIDISDNSGGVIAQGPADSSGSPKATILAGPLEFHLGWASWCGPGPKRPLTAHVGLVAGRPSPLMIPDGFGPSDCQGVPTILFLEPGW
jgi:hypothetical protein